MHGTLTSFLLLSALTCATHAARDEYDLDDINSNQLYLNKGPRFIKFESKDDEVEIELGVSVPVVKVPLTHSVDRKSGRKESGITVSPPGLVVAGVLLLTTFLVVPLLFTKKTYRTGKAGEGDDVWSVLKHIRTEFRDSFLDSPPCMETVICWTAKAIDRGEDGTWEKWMDDVLRSKWMGALVNGTFAEKAITTGRSDTDCWEKYSKCPKLEKIYKSLKRQLETTKQLKKTFITY